MSGRVSRRRIQRPICRDRASPFSVCFLALSIDEDSLSTENHKPRDPHNAARPKINWSFFKGSIRECCYMEVGAVSGVFVEVGWRSGLGAGSREVGLETPKNEARGRRRRKRGAGGRSRCVRWPRCALCGCAALKSAHLTSPQTVSATVQNNKSKSELFLFFSTADAVDGGQDRARLVGLEPGRDVGQVVALAEQNAIDLVPAPCLAAHLRKQTIRGIAAEGQTEAL